MLLLSTFKRCNTVLSKFDKIVAPGAQRLHTSTSLQSSIKRNKKYPTLLPSFGKHKHYPVSRLAVGPKLIGFTKRSAAEYLICLYRNLRRKPLELATVTAAAGSPHWKPLTFTSKKRAGFEKVEPVLARSGMLNYVQVLTTPTADTPGTTLLLHFDDKRYIIGNVSEGVQRAATQQKIGLLKVSNILLTGQTSWRTTGGLLGLILTVADGYAAINANKIEHASKTGKKPVPAVKRLKIYGSDNLMHTVGTARRFVFRKGTPLDVFESEQKAIPFGMHTWSDNNIKVWEMDISPPAVQRTSRKRSHEVMSEGDTEYMISDGLEKETAEEREERYYQMRKGVVSHMFDSNWKLDNLVTKKLSEVGLPATIFVRSPEGKIELYNGPMPGKGKDVPDIDVLVRTPWPGASIEDLPPTKPSKVARSYIIKNHDIRGKFMAKKAKELGVEPRMNKELTSGKSVTTKDGNVVTPDMVMEPSRVGGSFAVVELPTPEYIEGLVDREEWRSEGIMEGVGAIFWILGKGVLGDPRLAAFKERFSHLKHIVTSDDFKQNGLTFESTAKAELRLHLIDPERFPKLDHDLAADAVPEGFVQAQVGMEFKLEPKMLLNEDKNVKYFDQEKAAAGMLEGEFDGLSDEVKALAEAARQKISQPEYLDEIERLQADLPGKDVEVIPLGTGSALPSKYRNVSSTLIRVPDVGNYMLDCGENTLGQLKRVFGDETPQILKDLRLLWISHLHADHHLGTASVLRVRNDLDRESNWTLPKLTISSDDAMMKWISEYAQVEDIGINRVIQLPLNKSNDWKRTFDQSNSDIGLSAIEACRVTHCNGALAVVLRFPSGFSAAFSGDCRPSAKFAEMARDATVLIHEATFESGMDGDALAKKHCTTDEALWVAKQMRAKRVLLTHFSQRYPKVSSMEDSGEVVAVSAFDYMRVKVGDFVKVREFNGAIEKLYAVEEDES